MRPSLPDSGIRRLDLTTFPFPLLGRADEAIKCLLLARTCRSGMSAHRSLSGDKRTTYAKAPGDRRGVEGASPLR